ncbi:hypothetical protein MBLNU230_g4548t1 [Neophaeotheca triangularis]
MRRKPTSVVPPAHQHGQVIYAYCHIRTNQVIYSLSRRLNNNRALRQLPDVGANNKPTSLRKDLWRPLYTLHLPATATGAAQGLHAYKRLHEHRKVHEIAWKSSPLLSRPYSDEHIEQLKKKLENRGGAKEESVFDIIKRLKKKMRVKEIMDQKARSVADLATVLGEQEGMAGRLEEVREREARMDRQRVVEEMVSMAKRMEKGGEAVLEGLRQGLGAFEENVQAKRREGKTPQRQMVHQEERLEGLRRKIARLESAPQVVREAREKADEAWEKEVVGSSADREKRYKEVQEASQKKLESMRSKRGPGAKNTEEEIREVEREEQKAKDVTEKSTPKQPKDYFHRFLPDWPEALQYSGPSITPKRGFWRNKFRNAQKQAWALDGTTVHWANTLDAEYAGEWPEAVAHEKLVYSRHTAPVFDEEAPEDTLDKAAQDAAEAAIDAQEAAEQIDQVNQLTQETIDANSAQTIAHYQSRLQKLSEMEAAENTKLQASKQGSAEANVAQDQLKKWREQTAWVRHKLDVHNQVQKQINATWQEFVAQEVEALPKLANELEAKEKASFGKSFAYRQPVVRDVIRKGLRSGVPQDAADAGSAIAEEGEVRSAEAPDARI